MLQECYSLFLKLKKRVCTVSGLQQLQDEVPQEMLQNIMLATSRHATEQELLSASLLPFDKVSLHMSNAQEAPCLRADHT